MTMQIVHVIPPINSGGHRHEERFPDEMEETEILVLLGMRAQKYGLLKLGGQTVYYLDHPETVVAFGAAEDKKFVESKRIDLKSIPRPA